MLKKGKKVEAKYIIANMIDILTRDLNNEALYNEIIFNLKSAGNKKAKVRIINDSELIIESHNKSQIIGIKFEPSLEDFDYITFTKSLYEGHEESVTTIDYRDGEHIIVTNTKLTKIRNNDNIILGMDALRSVNIYQHNALRYSKEYKMKVPMNLPSDMGSSLDETIISEDNRAIKRIAKVDNNGNASLEYFANNTYYSTPFNTRINNLEENIGEYIPITEKEFEENLELFKDKTINRAI